MGIPLFFKIISEKYDDSLLDTIDSKSKSLFLDMNCLIHPCCRKVLDDNYSHKHKIKYEKRMFTEIKGYLEKIIEFCEPDFIYMAIDGVAPCAKMTQQRLRRFKTRLERQELNTIKDQLHIDYPTENWDTNAISPGTDFMITLTKSLSHYINTDSIFNGREVVLNGPNIPGEGEHKILNYIRKHTINNTMLIYGLDADLIMLALSSGKENIYLLRESVEFGQPKHGEFMYMDIDQLKCNIMADFKERFFMISLNSNTILEKDFLVNLIDDYIFICFLLGNDFLPHILSLDLRNDGLNLIMDAYISTFMNLKENLITQDYTINTYFLKSLIKLLSKHEDKIVVELFTKRHKLKKYFKIRSKDNEYDRRVEILNNYPILNMDEEYNITNPSLYCSDWRKRYYKHCFDMTQKSEIDDICENYFEGLVWTFNYYFKGCVSWRWNYHYSHAPTLKDLEIYLNSIEDINRYTKHFVSKPKHQIPVSPIVQLMTIMPKTSMELLPQNYHKLMTDFDYHLLHYYPESYKLDTLFKRYYWQCVPILPPIHLDVIQINVEKVKCTKEIKERYAVGALIIKEK